MGCDGLSAGNRGRTCTHAHLIVRTTLGATASAFLRHATHATRATHATHATAIRARGDLRTFTCIDGCTRAAECFHTRVTRSYIVAAAGPTWAEMQL